jgi:hypothetical protein
MTEQLNIVSKNFQLHLLGLSYSVLKLKAKKKFQLHRLCAILFCINLFIQHCFVCRPADSNLKN